MGWLVLPLSALFLLAGPVLFVSSLAAGLLATVRDMRATRTPLVLALSAVTSLALGGLMLVNLDTLELWCDRPYIARIQRNAKPIIEALGRFEQDEQRAPESLSELVPRYLASIPGTGWSEHPRFEYGGNNVSFGGLYVDVGRLLAWDQLVYAPDYVPDDYDEGMTTRLGDWVYYDE